MFSLFLEFENIILRFILKNKYNSYENVEIKIQRTEINLADVNYMLRLGQQQPQKNCTIIKRDWESSA